MGMMYLKALDAIISLVVTAIGGAIGSTIANKLKFIFSSSYRERVVNNWQEDICQKNQQTVIRPTIVKAISWLNSLPKVKLVRDITKSLEWILWVIDNPLDYNKTKRKTEEDCKDAA